MTSRRLDHALVTRGLARSRSHAGDLVRRGLVLVNDRPAAKAGHAVGEQDRIRVAGEEAARVSRGALKLIAALDAFALDPARRIALDIGASTGGFTEVLLERGAKHVVAVDVGTAQLHPRLAADARVTSLQKLDARALDPAHLPGPVAAITADVSFISLTRVLEAALELAEPDAWLVALVKPQFELGRDAVGKGGIVRDPEGGARAVALVRQWLEARRQWQVLGAVPSPVVGKSGNREMLMAAVRNA